MSALALPLFMRGAGEVGLDIPEDHPISRIVMDPSGCGGAPGCGHASDPPPAFDLPPPPRPPWLEDLENCGDGGGSGDFGGKIQSSDFAGLQLETCENTVILDAMMTGNDFESAFHSVAVVVVCAILVVIFSLTLGVVIFRRRKNLFHARHSETCGGLGSPPSPATSSPQRCGGDALQPSAAAQTLAQQRAKAAKMLYAQTLPSQQQQQQQTNHYIEDFHHQSRVVAMTVARSQQQQQRQQQQRSMIPLPDSTEVTSLGNTLSHLATSGHNLATSGHNLATHGHTRMELASQPPPSHNVYHNFPHIIIGGQPFYLIPSDPEDCAAFETGDPSYAYPQNVAPIYEEIDPDHDDQRLPVPAVPIQQGRFVTSDQGRVVTGDQARVVTSDVASSEYSSVQSDQGEAGSDTSSLRRPRLPPPQQQQQRAPLGRLVVNPMEQQQQQQQQQSQQQQALRRMPPHRSPASSTGSSSMYYYSDTMKNPTKQPNRQRVPQQQQNQQRLSDDFSDSGFSHRSNSKRNGGGGGLVKQGLGSSSSNSDASATHVDTKVVVEKDEDAGSTLV